MKYIFTFWWLLFTKYKLGWRPKPGEVVLHYTGAAFPYFQTIGGVTYIVKRFRQHGVVPHEVAIKLMLKGAFERVDEDKLKARFPF